MTDKEQIYIKTSGEGFWANKTDDPKVVEISNIPLDPDFNLDDLVCIDSDRKIIGTVEQKSSTLCMKYDKFRFEKQYKKIVEYFKTLGIRTEGYISGYVGLAVPIGKDKDDEYIKNLQKNCPIDCKIGRNEDF